MNTKVIADIELCLLDIKNGNTSSSVLQKLRNNLNKITSIKCEKIIYTKNTDKLFFGMSVIPIVKPDDVADILCSESPSTRFSKYYVELDSKLFESGLDLNGRELTAILLHEVGHIEGPEPIESIRNATDAYLAETDSTITLSDVKKNCKCYRFAIIDAAQKICNIFNSNIQEEIDADTYVVKLGYADYLESALNKIYKAGFMLNSDVDNRFIVLSWMLRICRDFHVSRIPTIRRLERARKLTASKFERDEIGELIDEIRGQATPLIREATEFIIQEKAASMLGKFKYKGIRGFDDDLAEFQMRARNVDREDEAILLMRSINTRMGIIDDYLYSEEIPENEAERWRELYKRYSALRTELSQKSVYRIKDFNIYVNYPDIEPRY